MQGTRLFGPHHPAPLHYWSAVFSVLMFAGLGNFPLGHLPFPPTKDNMTEVVRGVLLTTAKDRPSRHLLQSREARPHGR